jgi:hypothetical protein
MLVIFNLLNSFKIFIILKEKIRFINYQAFQWRKNNWFSALNKQLNLAMSRYDNLWLLVFSIEIRNSNTCAFNQFLIDFINLIYQLSCVCNHQNLSLRGISVDSKRCANCECTCLASSILCLCDQRVIRLRSY